MVLLALVSALLLIYEVFVNVAPENQKYIHYIDITIALIFLAEFIFHLTKSKEKTNFLKNRWWELLAAIPITTETTQALRALRLSRFLPLLEALRFIRLAVRIKLLLEVSQKFTKHTYLIYIATIFCSVVLLGAFGFHYFEYGVNPNVKSYFDSIWWAMVTTATIGYGDIYPITIGGRIVAIILMFFGVGTLGVLIAGLNVYIFNRRKSFKL